MPNLAKFRMPVQYARAVIFGVGSVKENDVDVFVTATDQTILGEIVN